MRIAMIGVLALAGCNLTAPVEVGPSAATQINVMEQCRAGFGVGGEADYQVDVGPAQGGGRTANVLSVPFGQVTAHWADRINDCAAAQLEIVPLAAPVVASPDAPDGSGVTAQACPQALKGMYRGTLYCRAGV